MNTNPLGVLVMTSTPPEDVGPTAAMIEDLGFGEAWVAEDYFFYGGFTASAAALASTSTIPVKLGIVASVARHPAVTAMEIANLARTYPGRFTAGIGHGVPAWTDQMALTARSPLSAMEECVSGIRSLLQGETVDNEGRSFTYRSVSLTHPATTDVPLFTGVVGPKSLALSGRIADGTVVSVLAGPTYVRTAREHIERGMAAGNRNEHLMPVFALSSVSEDSATARAAVRPALAMYLTALGVHNPLSGALGWNDHLAELLEGGMERVEREMPEEWIDEMAIAGNPAEVSDKVQRLLDAGASSVVLAPVNPASAADELRLVAKSVLPEFS
ncbi:Flavin-dependent oxidoreductase, luciferase family (includes alkanesulfonate monooxygenase SsuD and methylene tetrahydromethanopterin reductase) [Haloechinothrix alba]|uniref:Flavin-dependent oxidoreductase, luciferase family (Includes alkanesulfonate monooxygenase SsuD and methylene tetrahydromethanopterin reductase) n=1 Tax=Haloechinothrix alba TaxID=664784 RepID=A0A238Y4Q3_9PSEU|nr:LLM class flavin-dependent oxidoreductase [Haloechinothrix alba]SNR66256.1 Flavin-dependent oxidoreductase, luciferase family (includes alkanesulfonate monooxygenase SsuD and methylene tetrahydromethanopterin reductase) [Haloechinothrix alba]